MQTLCYPPIFETGPSQIDRDQGHRQSVEHSMSHVTNLDLPGARVAQRTREAAGTSGRYQVCQSEFEHHTRCL